MHTCVLCTFTRIVLLCIVQHFHFKKNLSFKPSSLLHHMLWVPVIWCTNEALQIIALQNSASKKWKYKCLDSYKRKKNLINTPFIHVLRRSSGGPLEVVPDKSLGETRGDMAIKTRGKVLGYRLYCKAGLVQSRYTFPWYRFVNNKINKHKITSKK